MQVLLDIPDGLEDRFEFIPQDALPAILIRLIKEGLEKEAAGQASGGGAGMSLPTAGGFVADVLKALQAMSIPAQQEAMEGQKNEPPITIEEVKPPELDDEDGTLGDLLDLLK